MRPAEQSGAAAVTFTVLIVERVSGRVNGAARRAAGDRLAHSNILAGIAASGNAGDCHGRARCYATTKRGGAGGPAG